MKRTDSLALLAGLLFGVGLGVSGMTSPAKVLGFLDVFAPAEAGGWDPSLMLVMVGAILVHMPFALRARRNGARPRLAPSFALPSATGVDARLLGGAALFGVGWGIAGFCPGPAVVSVVTLGRAPVVFVAAMVLGMWGHAVLLRRGGAPGGGGVALTVRSRP